MNVEYEGFIIEGDGKFGMKLIKGEGRKQLPKELKGLFTTATDAQRAIDRFLTSKEKQYGKASSAS